MGHKHGVYDSDTHFSINPVTRQIRNETSRKTTLIQGDHNSERFTFELPRQIEGHDMSVCNKVEVHYLNVSTNGKEKVSGLYTVDDLQISPDDEDVVICSWLISNNATQLVGALNFLLQFSCMEGNVVTYAWHTAIHDSIRVSDGINADGSTIETKWSRGYRYSKFTYDELNTAFKSVADYYCVEYIDGTTGSPTNVFNVNSVQCDGVHPTKEYYATIANWLGSKLF